LNKTRKDEKFGVVLGCRYFIRKIHYTNNEMFTNLQEGDEVIKVNIGIYNEKKKKKNKI